MMLSEEGIRRFEEWKRRMREMRQMERELEQRNIRRERRRQWNRDSREQLAWRERIARREQAIMSSS